jgi:hypothetical protein
MDFREVEPSEDSRGSRRRTPALAQKASDVHSPLQRKWLPTLDTLRNFFVMASAEVPSGPKVESCLFSEIIRARPEKSFAAFTSNEHKHSPGLSPGKRVTSGNSL